MTGVGECRLAPQYMWPARRVLRVHGGRALRHILSEDGCALAGLLVGGECVGDAARRVDVRHSAGCGCRVDAQSVGVLLLVSST